MDFVHVSRCSGTSAIYRSRRARSKTNSLDGRQGNSRYQFNRRYLAGKMDSKKDTKGGRQAKPNSKTNFELDTNKSLGPRSKPNGTQHPGSPTGGSGLSSIALQYSRKQTWNNSPKTHAETVGENLQLQYEERQRYIKYAAILAKGGIHGRLHSPTIPDNTGLLVASFYHGKPWRFVYIFIASLNMLLAIWEESTTIFGQRVRDTQQSTMVIRWIEMFCLAFFSFDVYLLYLYKVEQFFAGVYSSCVMIIIMALTVLFPWQCQKQQYQGY